MSTFEAFALGYVVVGLFTWRRFARWLWEDETPSGQTGGVLLAILAFSLFAAAGWPVTLLIVGCYEMATRLSVARLARVLLGESREARHKRLARERG